MLSAEEEGKVSFMTKTHNMAHTEMSPIQLQMLPEEMPPEEKGDELKITHHKGTFEDFDSQTLDICYPQRFYSHPHGEIWVGDVIHWLKSLETESTNLIFADPPYNVKKAEWDSCYTVALNKLDGVYYVDPRPEMMVNEKLKEQIKDFQEFLVRDLWLFSK